METTPAVAPLRALCPAGKAADVVRVMARTWSARGGSGVEVTTYEPGQGLPDKDEADVWVIRPAELPHRAAQGQLLPVPDDFLGKDRAYDWNGILPLYRDQLLVWDRTVYGLPLLGESPLCCFRSDGLADPAHQAAFQEQFHRPLAPPATWGEFHDIARYFHEAGAAGKPAPSLPPLPAQGEDLARLFYEVAAPFARRGFTGRESPGPEQYNEFFAFHYDYQTGRPRLASPGFVHALGLLQKLQAFRPAGTAADPAESFREGKAVLCLTNASWLLPFQKSGVRDKFGIGPVPGSGVYYPFQGGEAVQAPQGNQVPYLGSGGWLAVVPRQAARAGAAFDLIGALSGREISGQVVSEPRWGGGPIRLEQIEGRTRWDAYELDAARTKSLSEALQQTLVHPSLRNPVTCLRLPDQAAHAAVLVAELRAALTGGKGAKTALETVDRRWAELDARKGPAHLAEYRLSLGLLAH